MNTTKSALWLGFLLSLLLLLLANALSWLDDSFYNMLLSVMPYKWQLTILMMMIIALLFALGYSRSFSKPIEDIPNQPDPNTLDALFSKEHENILLNLSPDEKTILKTFLNENKKVINMWHDPIVKVLIRNNILRCLEYNSHLPSEIMIEEWAWAWINRNTDKL